MNDSNGNKFNPEVVAGTSFKANTGAKPKASDVKQVHFAANSADEAANTSNEYINFATTQAKDLWGNQRQPRKITKTTMNYHEEDMGRNQYYDWCNSDGKSPSREYTEKNSNNVRILTNISSNENIERTQDRNSVNTQSGEGLLINQREPRKITKTPFKQEDLGENPHQVGNSNQTPAEENNPWKFNHIAKSPGKGEILTEECRFSNYVRIKSPSEENTSTDRDQHLQIRNYNIKNNVWPCDNEILFKIHKNLTHCIYENNHRLMNCLSLLIVDIEKGRISPENQKRMLRLSEGLVNNNMEDANKMYMKLLQEYGYDIHYLNTIFKYFMRKYKSMKENMRINIDN